MSLKIFHVFFIILSALLNLGFGVWGIKAFAAQGPWYYLLLGALSLLGAVLLTVYLFWFFKKMKAIPS